jgi:hypothetical protein
MNYEGCSQYRTYTFDVVTFRNILLALFHGMFAMLSIFYMLFQKGGGTIGLEPRLSHVSAVEPTLAPVAVERTMTTRAAASVFFF